MKPSRRKPDLAQQTSDALRLAVRRKPGPDRAKALFAVLELFEKLIDQAIDAGDKQLPLDLTEAVAILKRRRQPAGGVRPVIINESAIDVVPASWTRHGPRMKLGKRQFVRGTILALPGGIPPFGTNTTKVVNRVRKLLAANPDFMASGLGEIKPRTIVNELRKLQRTS
jgi:hypothetical protein